jgi:hypothetical protein
VLAKWLNIPGKEDKTMTYTKPEVGVIGQAVQVIENYPQGPEKISTDSDSSLQVTNPAYDLDE